MIIINLTKNPSGAYLPPQTWDTEKIPEGFAIVPDTLEMSGFYENGGFAELTVADGMVTAITPNAEAWKAWQFEHPAPPHPISEQQQLAELTLKQAQQDAMLAELQQTNAQLLLQLAQTGGSVNV